MFDPRMMAPDGSSYSRANILASPALAATSGMTPPGVQTITGPAPVPVAGHGANHGGQGGPNGPRPQRSVFDNLDRFQGRPWYDQFMAAHPNFQPGQWQQGGFDPQQRRDMRADYQGQLGDWRAQNPMLGGGGQMRDWWSSRPQYSALQGF